MLRDTITPFVDQKSADPAEPRRPEMENQSALHKDIYDWVFIKPTGVFHKDYDVEGS